MVFTFWEGYMPDYIKLCMRTWKFEYIVLDYSNLKDFTDLPIDNRLKRFNLPQIADCIRVHVLRDNGGYWLDADTLSVTGDLPTEHIVGNDKRENTIGFLHTDRHSKMFTEWAEYQDEILADAKAPHYWNIMGNAFTDTYVKEHKEIKIYPISDTWAETYMIKDNTHNYWKYVKFYFDSKYSLKDLHSTDLLMLHNSWTPEWYKTRIERDVLRTDCTLTRILKELL